MIIFTETEPGCVSSTHLRGWRGRCFFGNFSRERRHQNYSFKHRVVWIAIVDLFEAIAPAGQPSFSPGPFLLPHFLEQFLDLLGMPHLVAAEDDEPFGGRDIAKIRMREFVP